MNMAQIILFLYKLVQVTGGGIGYSSMHRIPHLTLLLTILSLACSKHSSLIAHLDKGTF